MAMIRRLSATSNQYLNDAGRNPFCASRGDDTCNRPLGHRRVFGEFAQLPTAPLLKALYFAKTCVKRAKEQHDSKRYQYIQSL